MNVSYSREEWPGLSKEEGGERSSFISGFSGQIWYLMCAIKNKPNRIPWWSSGRTSL